MTNQSNLIRWNDEDGLTGYCQRIVMDKDEVEWTKDGVKASDWPRPDGDTWQKHGMAGFMFNGQTVELREGGIYTITIRLIAFRSAYPWPTERSLPVNAIQ